VPEKVGQVAPLVAEAVFRKHGGERKYRFFESDEQLMEEIKK